MTMHRRKFLQESAAAGTAIAALAASNARAAANDKIVVGVMGVNGRGASLAKSFDGRSDSAVAYVCDVDEPAMDKVTKSLKDQGGKPQGVKDFRTILDDKSVDALVIAAPDHWHGPATILACAAGKHVYVEKPACHNPREGELMVAAARKHNRVVQMGNQRRSRPKFIEGVESLRSGAVGRVYYVRSWYASLRGSMGHGKEVPVPSYLDYKLWQGPAPARPYKDNLIHYNWHWHWHWGTGELGNNGVHALDVCRWGLGVDYPLRVTASGGRFHWKDDQETPDTHVVSFEFAGGRMISYEGLSCNARGMGLADEKGRFTDGSFGVTFHGELGTLAFSDQINGYIIYDKSGKVTKQVSGPGGDADHISDFLTCIRTGGRPRAEIEEGVKSTLLCHLGNIAYRVGRPVQLDPSTHQITGDAEAAALWSREYEKGWEPKV
jgi:predicted dehydrogenase